MTAMASDSPLIPILGAKPVDIDVSRDVIERAGGKGIAAGLRGQYVKDEFCDLRLVASGESYPAHRAVMAAASPSFRSHLQKKISEAMSHCGTSKDTAAGSNQPVPGVADNTGDVAPALPSPTKMVSPTPETAADSDAQSTAKEEPSKQKGVLEVSLKGITQPEAVRTMLDYIYGFDGIYNPCTLDVNTDVLRLCKQFNLPHLRHSAAPWLTQGLTTANAVERLAVCEEFGLKTLKEKILEQLASNANSLALVSSSPEIMKHPKLLQELLVRITQKSSPPTSDPEPPAKKAKKT